MAMRYRFRGFETVSPSGWGLSWPLSDATSFGLRAALGIELEELLTRVKNAGYGFVLGLYDDHEGALRHFYRADRREFGAFDSGNFLMALNFVLMYDLFGDRTMLERAQRCFSYALNHFTETHPMAFWRGGVRDGDRPQDLWVKYTGDAFWLAQALQRRTGDRSYQEAIFMFHNFYKRAREAGYRYTFDGQTYQWRERGNVWQAFGFPVTSYLEQYEATQDDRYLTEAVRWGDSGLSLQAQDGLFYLLDGTFWNSDLTAPELRGLVYLWEATGEDRYLESAVRFADALLSRQNADGSWPLGIDGDGEVAIASVGPGDSPNIGLSLLRLHGATGDDRYLGSAIRAVRYGLDLQAVEKSKYPRFLDDPYVQYGFWSWDPLYDYSLSGDQSVHHLRGLVFLASYLEALALSPS